MFWENIFLPHLFYHIDNILRHLGMKYIGLENVWDGREKIQTVCRKIVKILQTIGNARPTEVQNRDFPQIQPTLRSPISKLKRS